MADSVKLPIEFEVIKSDDVKAYIKDLKVKLAEFRKFANYEATAKQGQSMRKAIADLDMYEKRLEAVDMRKKDSKITALSLISGINDEVKALEKEILLYKELNEQVKAAKLEKSRRADFREQFGKDKPIDGEVYIPIKFTVDEDNAVKKFIEDTTARMQDISEGIKNKSFDNSKEVNTSIDAVNKYVESIEAARKKMMELKDASDKAAEKAEKLKSMKASDYGMNQKDFDILKDKAISDAVKARKAYILQGTELQQTMRNTAAAASEEMRSIESLAGAYANTTQAVGKSKDLFKEALHAFAQNVKETRQKKFFDTYAFSEITEEVERMKMALTQAGNAFDSMHRNLKGEKVFVDKDATPELAEQAELLQEQGDQIALALANYEQLAENIKDGSIVTNLEADGKSAETFKNEILDLNKGIEEAIQLLMQFAAQYEHEAKIAAQTGREYSGRTVTKGAPRSEIGYAETSVQMSKEQAEAEEVKAKAAEEARKAQEKADKEAAAATRAQIKHLHEEESAIKRTTAQYYYKLRSVKMLGFVFRSVDNTVTKFGKTSFNIATKTLSAYSRLIPGINALRRAFDGEHKSQKKFNAESKKTVKTNGLMNMSFKDLIKNLLKYAFGIRSVYILFNKMRQAVIAGLGEMSKMFDDVNTSMSSIATSFAQMKAALTSIIEPIIHVLAPALEKLSALFAQLSYYAASFIAALTGQSMVYKAVRSQIDYAESLDKTAKSAKNAKKELSGLDKLNVLHSKDDSDDDNTGMAWEKVPIDDRMKEWADKFKEFLKKLFAPIKAAWDKWGAWVKASFKKMLNELLGLGKAIADDFWKVWAEPETQKIFENIFHIMGDIALIVAHLAVNFRNAWKHNQNGYRILKAIRDIILIITDSLVRMADYTVEWAKNLNFIPLLDAIADTLAQKIVPAVKRIMGLVETLYEQIFLNILKKFIEGGLPKLIRLLGQVVEIIGIIADKINFALKSGSNGINMVNNVSKLFDIVTDHIKSALDKTKEWAKNLDFRKLFVSVNNYLKSLQPVIESLSSILENLWTNVLLPFWQYLLETGFPKLLDGLAKINKSANWETITKNVNTFVDGLKPLFELAWDVLVQLITDVVKAFTDLFQSEEFGTFAQKFKDFFTNLKEDENAPARIAEKIKEFAKALIELKLGLDLVSKFLLPVVTGFMTILNVVNQFAMGKALGGIEKELAILAGKTTSTAGAFSGLLSAIAPVIAVVATIAAVIGTAAVAFGGFDNLLTEIKDRVTEVVEYLKGFIEQTGLAESFEHLKEIFGNISSEFTEFAQTKLKPVFELIFDVFKNVAKFIGGEFVALLDGGMTALGGIIEFISGMIDYLSGIFEVFIGICTRDGAKIESGLTTILDSFKTVFNGLIDFLAGLFEFLGDSIANIIDIVLPGAGKYVTEWVNSGKEAILGLKDKWAEFIDTVKEKVTNFFNVTLPKIKDDFFGWIKDTKDAVSKWKDDIIGFFADIKHALIGDPIVYDIRDGIEGGFSEWISQTASDVGGWVKDRVTDFTTLASNIGTTVGEIGTSVRDGFTTLKEGAAEKAGELVTTAKEKFESVRSNAQENFESSKFEQYGKTAVNGIESGLKAFGTVLSTAAKNANDLRARFNTGLATKVFTSIGKFIPAGLRAGLAAGLPALLSSVTNMCNQITSRIRSVLQMHSPSKVFKDFGLMMDKGMELGVEDGTKGITDAFEELMPADNTFDSFYDKFLSKMTELTTSVATLFDDMSLHITDVMNSLSNLAAMQNFNDQLASVSKMKVPSIVKGYSLPANAEFKKDKTTSTEIDLSDLPNIIKDAVIEAITSTTDLQTGDETTIINIDGKEVFQVVKDKNTEYKKRHGKSAFV